MKTDLWDSLKDFSFDTPGAAFSFSGRLRRENGWTADYTARVLDEYRRFLYLCVEAGHPVTPSDEVDQAWHLHLCYTRSYWEDLCRDTLRRPVHHGPTKGGIEEAGKFTDWYERTLQSYREHFGEEPPADIWPPSSDRFRRTEWVRVDRSRKLLISKDLFRVALFGLVVAVVTAGCGENSEPFRIVVLIGIASIMLIALMVYFSGRGGGKGGGKGGRSGSNGCGGAGGWGLHGCGRDDSDGGGSGCGGGGCGGD